METTNQKKMWHNNNSRGLRLLACMVFICMGMGSSAVFGDPPANDECVNAAVMPPGDYATGSFFVYTEEATPSQPGVITGCNPEEGDVPITRDVWYKWTATVTGDCSFKTCYTTGWHFYFDTVVAVYEYPCLGALVACNNDACGGGGDLQSHAVGHVEAGQTYLIRVGGRYGDQTGFGWFEISTVPDPTPGACCMPDDTCTEAFLQTECSAAGGNFQGDGSTCVGSICTPVGNAFTYQGKLSNNGVPVNDTVDVWFSLWTKATSGSQVGVASANLNVSVVDGLFTVTLNGGDEFGSNAFIGAARWLNIIVRVPAGSGNWTVLTPRQAITAAPFSKL